MDTSKDTMQDLESSSDESDDGKNVMFDKLSQVLYYDHCHCFM